MASATETARIEKIESKLHYVKKKSHGFVYKVIKIIVRAGIIIIILQISAPEATSQTLHALNDAFSNIFGGTWDWFTDQVAQHIVNVMWKNGHLDQIPSTNPDLWQKMLENGDVRNWQNGNVNGLPSIPDIKDFWNNGYIPSKEPSTNPNLLQRLWENGRYGK